MMRPDELSRPSQLHREKRWPGSTLELAERYLSQVRLAKKMREKRLFGPFTAYRLRRNSDKANKIRLAAAPQWGELYLRFRPIISNAFERSRSLPVADGYSKSDFHNRVVMAMEEEIERDEANNCFAALLWKALAVAAHPHASAFEDLRHKLHARAVVDSCDDQAAVRTIVLLAYLRGEMAMATGQPAPDLTDLEFDELEAACDQVGACLSARGQDLDRSTASVLTSKALRDAHPRRVVLNWIR